MKNVEERTFIEGEKLLKLIEEGNPEDILLEENLRVFNELINYELITINNGNLCLTDRGIKAKTLGVRASIEEYKSIKSLTPTPFKPNRKNTLYIFLVFLLLSSFLFFYISLIR